MAGNEWVVKVTADVKGVLDASRQIGQAGKQAGQQFKEGFSSGDQTITGLRGRLNELNQTLEKSVIGSKEFVAAQKQIAQAQAQVDSALRGGTSVMNGFGKALEGVALQAASFIGLYQAITFVGKAVNELDNAGAAVRTLGSDSKELSASLLGLSNELNNNISQGELLKASYDVISSGFTETSEVANILKASVLGATGGFAELGDVTKAVSGIINAYGLSASDAQEIVDSFVQTQNDGVITVKQFADNIGNVASIAAAAGIPLKDLSAAIATATLKGVPVEQTFTGLRQAITSILKPSQEAKTLAASLGISFDLASLKARGFGGFLADVQAKTGGAADKIAILLGSVEAQTAVQPLLNDQLQKYNELLANQTNQSGQAAKASEIATETIAGGFNQVANAVKNLAGSVNTALPDASKNFSQFAKVVGIGTKVIEAQGPAINKALSQAFAPFSSLSNIPGFDKIVNLGIDSLSRLLGGNKELTTELAKQGETQAQINARVREQEAIAGQILDNKRSQNLADQVANENARKLASAYSDLAKAQIDQQTRVSQAGINLGQALISLEDSRFGIIRNRNNYELQEAEKRGASEGEINAIKRQGDEIDRAALTFKYNALVQQQELQRVLLALQQEQAQLDAGSAASSAKLDLERAVLDLKAAQLANDTVAAAKAEVEIQKAQLSLQAANTKLETLTKIQAVESLIAGVTNETAQNQIKAEAAAKNLALAADGTFKAARGTREQFNSYQDSFLTPLNQAKTFQGLIRDTGLQVKDTGKGYYEITGLIGDAAKATGQARSQTAGLASNMANAADAARSFYNSLNAAAGLPPARFTGGPVDAGGTYRINDGPSGLSLGQESFLSASGALSLINRPMNSLWTAPSKGTVIPAHVTSRLKEAGALGGAGVLRAGPDPAIAHLAAAVGNLSQEVAELRRKAWNVTVPVRSDGSSLRLQKTVQRIR
jgi:TP901 family phage tail tape measure protein